MASVEPVATVVNGHTFTVDTRYVLAESRILGKGSFGVVCTAYDSVRKIDLAVKRIRPYANDDWDAKHTLREIRLLKLLGPHPNIISLYELSLFTPKTELYMMMELMDCDLHRVIQSKQALSEKHHKCFLKQMLEGIKAMHSIGVFHRDLKPGNILVSKDCQLRITDFGLARFMDASTRRGENELNPMTQYVVTRWYRPPELLLAPNLPYGEPVDLWSIGCILAELLRRKPLFPGKSHLNQAQLIFELKGYTNARELGFPVSGEAASFLDKKCRYRKQSLRKYVPDASEQALNLLEQLLAVNPAQRPTAEEALRHPFLADAEVLHDYSKTYLTRPSPEYFEFEHTSFTVPQLRALIEHEVEISAADAYRYQQPNSSSPGGVKRRAQWGNREEADEISPTTTNEEHSARGNAPQKPAGGAGAEAGAAPARAALGANMRRSSRTEDNMMDEEAGPPSQLPTQKGNSAPAPVPATNPIPVPVRSDKINNSNNPFRTNQVAPRAGGGIAQQGQQGQGQGQLDRERPKSSEEISTAASAYRSMLMSSRSERDLLADDTTDVVPVQGIPSGNILTAVRNEANPVTIPPGSRTKTPKTPSPKKMDQILQRDMINKRRFLLQQQQQQQQQGEGGTGIAEHMQAHAPHATAVGGTGNSRGNRNSFPGNGMSVQEMNAFMASHNPNNGNFGHHRSNSDHALLSQTQPSVHAQQQQGQQQGQGQQQQVQQQSSRFGKLIPAVAAPFPTIASRMSNISNRVVVRRGGAGSNPITGAPAANFEPNVAGAGGGVNHSGSAHANANMAMHHSSTIMHGGSNIINSEYASNQF